LIKKQEPAVATPEHYRQRAAEMRDLANTPDGRQAYLKLAAQMGTAVTPSGRSGRIGAAVSSCQSHGAKASPGCRKPYSRPNLSRQCGPRGLDGCASAAQGDLMLYFFDVTVNDRISVDLIGTECSSAGEMREEAVHALISIAKDEMREEDEQEFRISVRHRTNKVYMGALSFKGGFVTG